MMHNGVRCVHTAHTAHTAPRHNARMCDNGSSLCIIRAINAIQRQSDANPHMNPMPTAFTPITGEDPKNC